MKTILVYGSATRNRNFGYVESAKKMGFEKSKEIEQGYSSFFVVYLMIWQNLAKNEEKHWFNLPKTYYLSTGLGT